MRAVHIVIAMLILLLAACTARPTQTAAPASVSPIPPTIVPQASDTPAAAEAPLVTLSSTIPPTSLPATPAEPPLPAFHRALDFGIPAGNSYNPRALVVHPGLGRLYARTTDLSQPAQGLVTMLDAATGQVLAVAETGPDPWGEGDLAVDAVRGRLYAVNPGDDTAAVLDAATLDLVATLDGVARLAVDEANGRLYVAGPAGLRVLDAEAYQPLAQVSLPSGQDLLALGVDPVAGRVYLARQAAVGYNLDRYDANSLAFAGVTLLPGRPASLLVEPGRDRITLSLNDGDQALFWALDGEGRALETRRLGDYLLKVLLAVDAAGGRLFLARDIYTGYGVTVLDLATGREIADIPLDTAPNGVAWDEGTGRLFVSHTYRNQIAALDLGAGRVSAAFPLAVELQDLAVDPGRGRLYVTDSAGWLHVLDSDTGQEIVALPGSGRIAVDGPHGQLYTGGRGAGRVRIYDAGTLHQTGEIVTEAIPVADAHSGGLYLVQRGVYLASLETMTVTAAISDTLPDPSGLSPNPTAVDAFVDPGTGRLFAIIDNGIPGSNGGTYLYVYEPVTYQKVLTDTERSPWYLDIDPATGRAYVSRIHIGSSST
ncbi:MAG: hypothetical protein JXM73_12345, partial [Anaerolineae bacterium]|nr:hypothetical protein [Anaerolineae bacterium]